MLCCVESILSHELFELIAKISALAYRLLSPCGPDRSRSCPDCKQELATVWDRLIGTDRSCCPTHHSRPCQTYLRKLSCWSGGMTWGWVLPLQTIFSLIKFFLSNTCLEHFKIRILPHLPAEYCCFDFGVEIWHAGGRTHAVFYSTYHHQNNG